MGTSKTKHEGKIIGDLIPQRLANLTEDRGEMGSISGLAVLMA
jgi:hypothetical protein